MPYTFRIRRTISVYDRIVVNSLISIVYYTLLRFKAFLCLVGVTTSKQRLWDK